MIQAKFSLTDAQAQFLSQRKQYGFKDKSEVVRTALDHLQEELIQQRLADSADLYTARVPVIQVVPFTAWSEKKARIITNVEIIPSSRNGCSKKSVVDCLQTRPVDHRARLVGIRGELEDSDMAKIDAALKIVFDLS